MTWAVHVTLAPTWFDPGEHSGIVTILMVLYAIHDAMVKPMPGNAMAPSLAESWTAAKDGLSYEFVLRKGVVFHNGDPLTAEDVKFTFERYKGAAAKLLKEKVAAVEIVDPHRVRFRLKEPWPDFMTFYGTPATGAGWIVPKKYIEKVGDDGFKKAPVGAGPYKLAAHNPGVELVLEAHDRFWRKTPAVKRLVWRVVPEDLTRLAMLKRGEVDVAYSLRGPLGEEVQRTPGLKLVPTVISGTQWLDFGPLQWDPKSPWHDRRVRLAAALAFDRNAINQAETLGHSKPTGSIIPSAFEYALAIPPYPYDPARAKKLLAEAGLSQWLRRRRLCRRLVLLERGRGHRQLSGRRGHPHQGAPDGAGRLPRPVEGQADPLHHAGGRRRPRQRRHPGAELLRQGRALHLGEPSRHGRPLRPAGARARPQAPGGAAAPDPAPGPRAGHAGAALGAGLSERHRPARGGVRPWPHRPITRTRRPTRT